MKWILLAVNLLWWEPSEYDTQDACDKARIAAESAMRADFPFINANFQCVSRLNEAPENWR